MKADPGPSQFIPIVERDNELLLLADMPGCEGLFISKNLSIKKTDGFAG